MVRTDREDLLKKNDVLLAERDNWRTQFEELEIQMSSSVEVTAGSSGTPSFPAEASSSQSSGLGVSRTKAVADFEFSLQRCVARGTAFREDYLDGLGRILMKPSDLERRISITAPFFYLAAFAQPLPGESERRVDRRITCHLSIKNLGDARAFLLFVNGTKATLDLPSSDVGELEATYAAVDLDGDNEIAGQYLGPGEVTSGQIVFNYVSDDFPLGINPIREVTLVFFQTPDFSPYEPSEDFGFEESVAPPLSLNEARKESVSFFDVEVANFSYVEDVEIP